MGFWQSLFQYVTHATIYIFELFTNGGLEPVVNDGGLEHVVNNGGVEPTVNDGGLKPIVNNEGCEPIVYNGDFEHVVNKQGLDPVVNKVNYWQLSMDNINEARTLLRKGMLNENQCRNLVSHLEGLRNISSIRYMLVAVEKNLYRITFNSKLLISECRKENWLAFAILQYNNREAFRELLTNMDTWFNTMSDILQHHSNQDEEVSKIRKPTFEPSTFDDVVEDLLALHEMIDCKRKQSRELTDSQGALDIVELSEPWNGSVNHKGVLAYYTERRIVELSKTFGAEINKIIPDDYYRPHHPPHPVHHARLSPLHPFTNVYESKWLGMNCVTKVFSIPMETSAEVKEMILKEACTMEELCHPNIIKLYYCGYFDNSAEGEKFMIIMEKGQMTLSKMLKKYKEEKRKLCEEVKLDIILQIASGICYMHDRKIAHRDLKLENVVVNTIFPKEVDLQYVHVRLLDFGLSEVKRRSASQVLARNGIVGTVGYIAPEVFEVDQVKNLDVYKADVFSFSMMCSEVLSMEKPFGEGLRMSKYRSNIDAGIRPPLGEDCSQELALLMESCWSKDPLKRPTFRKILESLTMMKKAMLQGSLLTTKYVEVYDEIDAPKRLVGVQEKIIMLEGILQNVGAVGIIGVSGVGKSTLAKALSTHIGWKFKATCYVDDFKHGSCRLLLKAYNLNLQPKVLSLEEGCDILRCFRTTRTLIVLDGVPPESPLTALLEDESFNKLDCCNIIATSRSWNFLERFIPLEGRYDHLLNNNQSLELFSMHALTRNQHLPTYLPRVVEKIARTCNGLPLTMQVAGSHTWRFRVEKIGGNVFHSKQ